jgi:hypothetical protein
VLLFDYFINLVTYLDGERNLDDKILLVSVNFCMINCVN